MHNNSRAGCQCIFLEVCLCSLVTEVMGFMSFKIFRVFLKDVSDEKACILTLVSKSFFSLIHFNSSWQKKPSDEIAVFLCISHFLVGFLYNCDEKVMWNSCTVISRNIRKPSNASSLSLLSFKWNNKMMLLAQLFLTGTNCQACDGFFVKKIPLLIMNTQYLVFPPF